MGASESKLAFKKSIFRLSDRAVIAPNDPYWVQVSELAIPSLREMMDQVYLDP